VDLAEVQLNDWQKEALTKAAKKDFQNLKKKPSKNDWTKKLIADAPPVLIKKIAVQPVVKPQPPKRVKTEEEIAKENEERRKELMGAMKFFDTNDISSDEAEEEDD
jgi:hypothetical protein